MPRDSKPIRIYLISRTEVLAFFVLLNVKKKKHTSFGSTMEREKSRNEVGDAGCERHYDKRAKDSSASSSENSHLHEKKVREKCS